MEYACKIRNDLIGRDCSFTRGTASSEAAIDARTALNEESRTFQSVELQITFSPSANVRLNSVRRIDINGRSNGILIFFAGSKQLKSFFSPAETENISICVCRNVEFGKFCCESGIINTMSPLIRLTGSFNNVNLLKISKFNFSMDFRA